MTARLIDPRLAAIWTAAALATLATSYGVAEDKRVVAALLVFAAVPPAVVLVVREPRWAIVGLVFAVYANLFEAAQAATGLPISKRVAIVGTAALLLLHRKKSGGALPARRDVILVLTLLAVLALSTAAATDRSASLGHLAEVTTVAVLALMVGTLDTPQWLARAAWATAGAGAALAALSLYQQRAGTTDNTYFGLAIVKLDGGVARSGGPFEPNFFAQALVLSAALATFLALRSRRRPERIAALLAAAVCVAGIGATASRGGVIALGIVLVLTLALWRPPLRLLAPLAAGAILVGAYLLPSSSEQRLSSVAEVTNFEQSYVQDTSVRGRVAENLAAVAMFRNHPLLGVGTHNFPVRYADYSTFVGGEWRPVREPHNLFLEAAAETGTIGLTVFLGFLWATLAGAWRARHRLGRDDRLLVEGAFVGMVGVLATGIFLHGAFPSITWTAFALAWAARAVGRHASRDHLPGAA